MLTSIKQGELAMLQLLTRRLWKRLSCCQNQGIIGIGSAHGSLCQAGSRTSRDRLIVVNLSGRGDKDVWCFRSPARVDQHEFNLSLPT